MVVNQFQRGAHFTRDNRVFLDGVYAGTIFKGKRPNVLDGFYGWCFRGNETWRAMTGEPPGNYPTWERTLRDLKARLVQEAKDHGK